MCARTPLSVVVITHERPTFVEAAIDSVVEELARFDGDCELVVVDSSETPISVEQNGPTNADEPVRMLHEPDRRSAAGKRNAGVVAARYDWVVFMDDDCEMAEGTLAAVADAVENCSADIGGFVGTTTFRGPKHVWFRALEGTDFTADFSWAAKGEDVRWGPTSMAVFRKSAFEAVDGFDEAISAAGGEDVDLCVRLRKAGMRLVGVPDAVAYHTTRTWNTPGQNVRRVFRYGFAEGKLMDRYPEHTYPIRTSKALALVTAAGVALSFGVGQLDAATTVAILGLLALAWTLGKALLDYTRYPLSPLETAVLTAYRFGYEAGTVWQAVSDGPRSNLVRRLDWWFGTGEGTRLPTKADAIRWAAVVLPLVVLFGYLRG